jgi:alanyl-tRNA synthetase
MGTEVSSIELSIRELTDAQIDEVEKAANAIVWEARPVQIVFEDAESVEGLRKASARAGTLRVIEISGLDRSACGGTHVRSTAELGPIQVLRSEKIRGNVRVEFVCGGRALRYSKQEHRMLAELSRLASTAAVKLPQYLSGLQERLAQAEKSQQRLNTELARRDAEETYRNIGPSGDGIRRWLIEVGAIDESARAKAQAFARSSRAIALVTAVDAPGVLIACSADSGLNAGLLLREALARVGGRGGGSATLAQGSVPDRSVVQELKQHLGFEASVSSEPERQEAKPTKE